MKNLFMFELSKANPVYTDFEAERLIVLVRDRFHHYAPVLRGGNS